MNKTKKASLPILFITLLFISGCSSSPSGVMQMSSDTYIVSHSSAAGAFTNMAKLRAGTIQEANEYAAARGKIAVVIAAREIVPTHGFPSYEYQFRLMDRNDPRASGGSLSPRADVVIEKTETVTANVTTKNDSEKSKDLYTEIVKLDDLRKKGLITDAEYEVQKKRVLSEQGK